MCSLRIPLAGFGPPDKAGIMHTPRRDTVYLTVWKYKFGPASRLSLPCGYKQGRVVAVGKHPEVKAVGLLPCSSGRRVVFPPLAI